MKDRHPARLDQLLRRGRRRLQMVLVGFILSMVGALVASFQLGTHMGTRHAPELDALLELKLELTSAHLWFQQRLAGNTAAESDAAARHLRAAEEQLQIILAQPHQPLPWLVGHAHPEVEGELGELERGMDKLQALAARRLLGPGGAAGSAVNARYDDLYQGLMASADRVEAAINHTMATELWWFQILQVALVGACLVLLGTAAWLNTHHIRRLGREVHRRRESERKLVESERAAVAARDEARAANAAKDLFLAKVSHEVRTPINAIVGMSTMLQDTNLSAEQRRYLRTLETETNSLLEIIDDLLDLSKVNGGRLTLCPTELDLRELVAQTTETLVPRAREKGISLDVVLAADFPAQVRCDGVRIRQVLRNLLRNATKFTEKGEVVVELDCGAVAGTEAVEAVVRILDTGPGFCVNDQARIFEPFTQGDEQLSRRYGGTGLGLTIAREIVELMGGEIGCYNRDGGGSCFWFRVTLPVARSSDFQVAPAESRDLEVCLVDTDDPVRARTVALLRGVGVEPQVFARATDALNHYADEDEPPLFVVSDRLTDLKVEALVRHLLRRVPTPRVWAMLSSEVCGRRDRLLEAGASAVFLQTERGLVMPRLLRGSDARTALPASPQTGATPPTDTFDARVLLVDDHPVTQLAGQHMLNALGCRVDVVAGGYEALRVWRDHDYDLVFLDWQMPDLDGLEVTQQIRAEEQQNGRPRTRILAMTANSGSAARRACLEAGMDDHLDKPASQDAFRKALAENLPGGFVRDDASGSDRQQPGLTG